MNRYVSIKVVLDRLMRHPLMQDISFETVVDYIVDFLRITGIPKLFLEKTVQLPLVDYRTLLPCDLVSINQVKDLETCTCMRASTDSFHYGTSGPSSLDPTFKVQGNVLFSNRKNGNIEISYKAIAVDDEGYPLVPDDSSVLRAMELYVKSQWFTILFDLGKIQPAVLQNTQQEYAFAAAACHNSLVMPSLSEMESITNSWNTLLLRTNEFRDGFVNNGAKELIRVQY